VEDRLPENLDTAKDQEGITDPIIVSSIHPDQGFTVVRFVMSTAQVQLGVNALAHLSPKDENLTKGLFLHLGLQVENMLATTVLNNHGDFVCQSTNGHQSAYDFVTVLFVFIIPH
jgi:hypothetical protein